MVEKVVAHFIECLLWFRKVSQVHLFKFWVQGDPRTESLPDDTWLGVPFTDADAVAMAKRCGFEPRYRHGAGEQYFILWYFKE